MQRTKEDVYALIQKGERLHAECKEAFGALPDSLWESYSSFANPGTFLISREDAIAGGNSEPRNEKIFNIFALVKIGERSGAGLSDLYGQWEKYGFPPPVIEEKYDPDRTVIRIAVEVGSGKGSVESSVERGAEVNKNCTRIAQEQTKNNSKTDPGPIQGRVSGSVKSSEENDGSVNGSVKINDMNSSARRVYHALSADNSLTYAGLMSMLQLSNRTVEVAVSTLIKRGLLRRVGPKKGGHWEIVK